MQAASVANISIIVGKPRLLASPKWILVLDQWRYEPIKPYATMKAAFLTGNCTISQVTKLTNNLALHTDTLAIVCPQDSTFAVCIHTCCRQGECDYCGWNLETKALPCLRWDHQLKRSFRSHQTEANLWPSQSKLKTYLSRSLSQRLLKQHSAIANRSKSCCTCQNLFLKLILFYGIYSTTEAISTCKNTKFTNVFMYEIKYCGTHNMY